MVLGYLRARLLPTLKERFVGRLGLVVEALCLLVVPAGTVRGPRRVGCRPPGTQARGPGSVWQSA